VNLITVYMSFEQKCWFCIY